jgi:hypothetical protein
MAVCSDIHTKHVNKLCGQNVELFNLTWRYINLPLGLKDNRFRKVSYMTGTGRNSAISGS